MAPGSDDWFKETIVRLTTKQDEEIVKLRIELGEVKAKIGIYSVVGASVITIALNFILQMLRK